MTKSISPNPDQETPRSQSQLVEVRDKISDLEIVAEEGGLEFESEQQLQEKTIKANLSDDSTKYFRWKAAAAASAIAMLPILAIGTATYYLGSTSVDKQITIARRVDPTGLAETELNEQKKLLANLSIGTGVSSILAGLLAAAWVCLSGKATEKLAHDGEEVNAEIDTSDNPDRRSQSVKDFVYNSTQLLERQDIFQLTVSEAQKILDCDRVLVYSLDDRSRGVIVAEAVKPGFFEALGTIVEDPCFEAKYIELYRNGRVQSIDDIEKADLTPCYLEQLTSLQVRANLVVPILYENNLSGLLVAHQCCAPRNWEQQDIDYLTQLAERSAFVLEYANLATNRDHLQLQLQKQATIENQWTHYFNSTVGQISSSLERQDILNIIVEEIQKVLHCDRVVVYSTNAESQGVIIAEAVAAGWTRALGMVINDPCFAARYIEMYRDGRVRALDNIYESGMTSCYIEQLEKLEVKANLVAPIINEGKLEGLLVAHQCNAPRAWQQHEVRWVSQIATRLGFVLEQSELIADYQRLQRQAEVETQWTHYLTDAIQYIRASLNREDILQATVKEVRRILNCDRVVIYSTDKLSQGVVVAESVASGWTRALGITIQDPCFEARYIEKYRNGRVRALANIREAGLTPCYIEQLEVLEVKANLVAPVINEGKLLGLLVSHQCDAPRYWHHHEVRWLAQLAAQVGFALDNASLLVNADRLEQQSETELQLTQHFTNAVRYIRDSLVQEDILDVATEEVRRVLNCDRVVIYSMDRQSHGVIIAESVAPGWTRAKGTTINDPCFEARYLEKYRNGRVRALANIREAGLTSCYIEQLETLQVKANLVTPVIDEGKLFGLLVAHQCDAPRDWQQNEIRWVTQIATQIGFALDNAKLLRKLEGEGKQLQLLKSFASRVGEIDREDDLLEISVEEARQAVGVDRVIVYAFDRDWAGTVVAESVVSGVPKALRAKIKDPCFAQNYAQKYKNGRVRSIDNIYEAQLTDCHLEQLEPFSVKASAIVPILQNKQLFGLLIAHQCQAPHQWQESELDLLSQFALQLGYTLDRICLRRELGRGLKETNDRANIPSQERHFQQEMSEILQQSKIGYENLAERITHQSQEISRLLDRLQTSNSADKNTPANFSPQKALPATSSETNPVGLDRDSIDIQKAIAMATAKLQHLNQSYQALFEIMNAIDNPRKHLGQREKFDQSSLASMAQAATPLINNLTLETSQIESSIADLVSAARQITEALDANTQTIEINPLGQNSIITPRILDWDGRVAHSGEVVKDSAANVDHFMTEIAEITSKISEQSMTIAESFNKLAEFTQKNF
jgi:methyl-accepting chemotaxis protein PixJ